MSFALPRTLAVSAVLAALALTAGAATAQTKIDAEQMIRKLQCQPGQDCAAQPAGPRTRSITPGAAPKKRSFTFVTEEGRKELDVAVKDGLLPSADVEVYFAYNSADIQPQTRETLDGIAKVLADPRLRGQNFVFVGHTDGVGAADYNLNLSNRRAEAVRTYLLDRHGIPGDRFTAFGRGKEKLKNPADPRAAENRRVQLINLGDAEVRQ